MTRHRHQIIMKNLKNRHQKLVPNIEVLHYRNNAKSISRHRIGKKNENQQPHTLMKTGLFHSTLQVKSKSHLKRWVRTKYHPQRRKTKTKLLLESRTVNETHPSAETGKTEFYETRNNSTAQNTQETIRGGFHI